MRTCSMLIFQGVETTMSFFFSCVDFFHNSRKQVKFPQLQNQATASFSKGSREATPVRMGIFEGLGWAPQDAQNRRK